MSKKDINRNQENLKGRDVFRIYRSCVEAGVTVSINIMSILNQKRKGGEAQTKKRKRMNETVSAERIVPRKKK